MIPVRIAYHLDPKRYAMSLGHGNIQRPLLRGLAKAGLATGPKLCTIVFTARASKVPRGRRRAEALFWAQHPNNVMRSNVRRAIRSLYSEQRIAPYPEDDDRRPKRWMWWRRPRKQKPRAVVEGQEVFNLSGGLNKPRGGILWD